jgi:TP901 family phage tail tape measure protein
MASAIQVASLFGVLSLRDTMTSGLQSAEQQAQRFGSNISMLSGQVSNLGGVMVTAAAGGAVAVTGFATAALGEFSTFQSGMNEVFSLMPGASQDTFDRMTQDVQLFADRMGVLPEELIPSLYEALSSGIPADNVFEFLETSQMAAVGGVTNLATTVNGISSVMNAYGHDVLDATRASDLMFTAVVLGKTTFEELSNSIYNVTPTAAAAGVRFEDVAAGLAAITAQGVPTAVATTQMRQLLVELADSGSQAGAVFEEVAGQSFTDFIAAGGNVSEALTLMQGHADSTGVGLNQLFGSVEAGSAALSLSGTNADRYNDFLSQMETSAGATETAFNTLNTGIARGLEFLSASMSLAMSTLGSMLAPFVEPAINMLTTFFRIINAGLNGGERLSDWLMDLPAPLRGIGLMLGEVSASIFEFFSGIQGADQVFGITERGAYQLGAGIGDLVSGLVTNFQMISDSVMSVIAPVMGWIGANIQLQDILLAVGIAVTSFVVPAVIGMVAPIVGTFALLVGGAALLRQAWESDFGGIRTGVGNLVTWFTGEALPAIQNFIMNQAIPTVQSFMGTLAGIWAVVAPTLGSLFNWFMAEGLPIIQAFITDTAVPAIQNFIGILGGIWETVSPVLFSLFDWFMTTGLPLALDYVTNVMMPGMQGFIDLLLGIWNAVEPVLTTLLNWFITDGLPLVGDFIDGTFVPLFTGFTDLMGSVWDVVGPGLELFKENIGGIFQWISDNVLTPFLDTVTSILNQVNSVVSGAANMGGSMMSGLGGWVDSWNPFAARADGGPVTAGTTYLVGERGPELFRASQSGSIISNRDTAAAMSGGGDTLNFYGNIITSDPEDFMQQLEERRRRRR